MQIAHQVDDTVQLFMHQAGEYIGEIPGARTAFFIIIIMPVGVDDLPDLAHREFMPPFVLYFFWADIIVVDHVYGNGGIRKGPDAVRRGCPDEQTVHSYIDVGKTIPVP